MLMTAVVFADDPVPVSPSKPETEFAPSFDRSQPPESRTVTAEQIMAAAQAGKKVDVSGAYITGALALRHLILSHEFNLKNCDITGTVDFSYTTFKQGGDFSDSSIAGEAQFSGAEFDRDTLFKSTKFMGERAVFQAAQFVRAAYFNLADFQGEANFELTNFGVNADFTSVTFAPDYKADYSRVQVAGILTFNQAQFGGELNLYEAKIDGDLEMEGAQVAEDATFDYVTVKGNAQFQPEDTPKPTVFRQGASFDSANISGRLNLEAAEFDGDASFNGIKVGDDAIFDFASIGDADKFNHVIFKGNNDFIGAQIGGQLNMDAAEFDGEAKFNGLTVADLAHFDAIWSAHDGTLWPVVFKQGADFGSAKIGDLEMHAAEFDGDADFNGMVIGNNANFDPTKTGKTGAPASVIFKGKAEFVGVRVGGQLNMDAAEFDQEADFDGMVVVDVAFFNPVGSPGDSSFKRVLFKAEAKLGYAKIGALDMRSVEFEGEADFNSMTIEKNADFSPVDFVPPSGKDKVSPRVAVFQLGADFSFAKISGQLNLKSAHFIQKVKFNSIAVGGMAFFDQATGKYGDASPVDFEGDAEFYDAVFNGALYMDGAEFKQSAYFNRMSVAATASFTNGTHFAGSADFSTVTFNGPLLADGAIFQEAIFSSAKFQAAASFSGTQFRRAKFDYAHFAASADFTNLKSGRDVSLAYASSPRLNLPDAAGKIQFLNMQGCDYNVVSGNVADMLRALDGSENGTLVLDRQVFLQLEKAFRQVGKDDEADTVYLHWQTTERDKYWREQSWGKWLLSTAYKALVKYGIQPWRLAVYAGCLLILGMVYFCRVKAVTEEMKQQDVAAGILAPTPRTLPWPSALGLTLRYFLPVSILLGQQWVPVNEWIDTDWHLRGRKVKMPPGTFVGTFLTLMGWVLVPLAVAAVSGWLKISS